MIRLWDAATGVEIQTLQDPDLNDALFAIFGLAWSPNGRFLAVAYTFRGVQVWEVNTGVRHWSGDDNAIHIWDLESGNLLHTHRHDRPYERLNMSKVKGLTEAQKASLRMLGAINCKETNLWDHYSV